MEADEVVIVVRISAGVVEECYANVKGVRVIVEDWDWEPNADEDAPHFYQVEGGSVVLLDHVATYDDDLIRSRAGAILNAAYERSEHSG